MFADAGYTVEVFLAGYECDGASGRAMNRALTDAYSPFPVDAVWMERQPPCHQPRHVYTYCGTNRGTCIRIVTSITSCYTYRGTNHGTCIRTMTPITARVYV